MADIKINLLPWREQRREDKKREFLQVLAGVAVLAGAITFGVDRFYNSAIDTQASRNTYLQKEITVLEGRIQEIQQLQTKRQELLARMQVIQSLQGNRPIIVRVFDELARQLADRVFYTDLRLQAGKLDIQGVAESNNRISSQLRNFDESEWFKNPNVRAINAQPAFGPQAAAFTLTVLQDTPQKEEDE